MKKKDVTIGKLRTPPIGDEGVLLSLTVRTPEGRFYAAISWFRVDRALSFLVIVGLRPAGPVAVAKLGGMIVAHVGQQFTPVSTVPPTITGTPQQGQTLTASTGKYEHDAGIYVRVAALRRSRRGVRRHRRCDRIDLCRRGGGRRHHAPRHGHREEPFRHGHHGQWVQTAVVT